MTGSPTGNSKTSIRTHFRPRKWLPIILWPTPNEIDAPVRCGTEVIALRKSENGDGFRAETSGGVIAARNVVVATGAFQKPIMPKLVPESIVATQVHSHGYRNPGQLPEGAVLVVGAGSSGTQIADELMRAGRKVYLSVGPHNKPPRRYRGKDFVWWLGALGHWTMKAPHPGMEHITIAVSGAYGGKTIDFRKLALQGMTLIGRSSCDNGIIGIAGDLRVNLDRGNPRLFSRARPGRCLCESARAGLCRWNPRPGVLSPDSECITNPLPSLDLLHVGITSIIWATGYEPDYAWVKMDAFDAKGRPRHERGVSIVPGLYFLGLPWLSNRSSSFIWGCWHDAKYLSETITKT